MTKPSKKITKKEFKTFINKKGGFIPVSIEKIENNFSEEAEKKIREKFAGNEQKINEILTNAVYIRGISSTGELNRNGYVIDVEAWRDAIPEYLNTAPLVLLQHDAEEIIGETFSAEITKEGLVSEMYIYPDQMTEMNRKRFERGQLKALSTGHITKEAVFENEETGERISSDEFMKLPFEQQMSNVWTMIVTALEWVEQSLVSIPSNRKTYITKRNSILNYMKNNLGAEVPDDFEEDEDVVVDEDSEPEMIQDEPQEEVSETTGDQMLKEIEDAAMSMNIHDNSVNTEETEKEEVEPKEEVDTEENPTGEVSGNDAEEGENPEDSEKDSGNESEDEEPAEVVEGVSGNDEEPETQANSVKKTLKNMSVKFTNGLVMRYEKEVEQKQEQEEEKAVVKNTTKDVVEKNNADKVFEKLVLRTDSFDSIIEDLNKNGYEVVANKVLERVSSIDSKLESALAECEKYKNIVKNTPKNKAYKVIGQEGVITPNNISNDSSDGEKQENTIANKLENAGAKIKYTAKNSMFDS